MRTHALTQVALFTALLGMVDAVRLFGQQDQTPVVAATPTATSASQATKELQKDVNQEIESTKPRVTRRLPRFYASIVNQQQRLEIYAIQESYRMEIEKLEQQLAELRSKEMQAIEKLLSPSQREQLMQKQGDSKLGSPPRS